MTIDSSISIEKVSEALLLINTVEKRIIEYLEVIFKGKADEFKVILQPENNRVSVSGYKIYGESLETVYDCYTYLTLSDFL